MKILFIGDIMGRAGREALEARLPALKAQQQPDVVIVNGENAANGSGITMKIVGEFFDWGVDVITTGNHVFGQREMLAQIAHEKRVLRPHNYPPGTPGSGVIRYQLQSTGQHIVVINLMGRLFMDPLDDPFQVMETALKDHRLGQNADAIFVDFHAETTSEKMAFAHHFDGRISAVIGTHTHIPTADAHVLPGGTAYQSDAGMTGSYDSIIGVEKDIAIHRFVKKTPPSERKRPAKGEGTLCGAVIDVNAAGLATAIEPVRVGGILKPT